ASRSFGNVRETLGVVVREQNVVDAVVLFTCVTASVVTRVRRYRARLRILLADEETAVVIGELSGLTADSIGARVLTDLCKPISGIVGLARVDPVRLRDLVETPKAIVGFGRRLGRFRGCTSGGNLDRAAHREIAVVGIGYRVLIGEGDRSSSPER